MTHTLILTPIELLINGYLRLDAEIFSRFAQLSGKTLVVKLQGLDQIIYISPDKNGIKLTFTLDTNIIPSTIITGTPLGLLKLLKSGSHHITALSDEVSVEGDLEFAQDLQNIFQAIDIDWEEHLSRLIGDIPAHQIGNVARGTLDYGRQTLKNFHQTGTEYIQEELRYLPSHEETQDFISDIDETRDAVERLEARIRYLETMMEIKP